MPVSMSLMDVDVVDIRKAGQDGKVKAFANVKFGGALIIRGFRVVDGSKGLFVSLPSKPGKDKDWFDVIAILDDGLKEEVEGRILEAYDRETDGIKN